MPAHSAIVFRSTTLDTSRDDASDFRRGACELQHAPNEIAYLARLPRIGSRTQPSGGIQPEVKLHANTPTMDPPSVGENRYGTNEQTDSTRAAESAESLRAENVSRSPEAVHADFSTEPKAATAFHKLTHDIRHQYESRSQAEISALVARVQTMIKPLARVIVLVALLAAAGLAYMALDNQSSPASRPIAPIPIESLERGPEFSATATVDSVLAARSPSENRHELEPTAHGPSGDYTPSVTITATSPSDDETEEESRVSDSPNPKKAQPTPSDTYDSLADCDGEPSAVESSTNVESHTSANTQADSKDSSKDDYRVPPAYPTTPHPIIPIDMVQHPTSHQLPAPTQPTAVAELTGDVKPIRK